MISKKILLAHLSCGPLILIITSIFKKYSPKNIYSLYGYRTIRSMKNQDIWQTANTISAKYLFQASLATTIFQTFGIALGNKGTDYILYSYIFLIISIGASIWITEARLNQLFDKQGKRLNKEL